MLITISSIVSGQLFQLAAQNQRVEKLRGDRRFLVVTKYLLCLMSNDKEMQIDIHKEELAGTVVGGRGAARSIEEHYAAGEKKIDECL